MFHLPCSIFNFTHVYEAYSFMQSEDFRWVDCTQLEGTDCYCDTEAERRLKEMMLDLPLQGVHWLDTGDYHYLSKLWTDKVDEPFTLVVLDHHPDMQRSMFGELLSCGSWVRAAIEQNGMLKQVYLVGVDDKLIGETLGFGDKVKVVSENELNQQPLSEILARMQIYYPIYISIDKDVMTPNECSTNWDQGSMTWTQLTTFLEYLMKHRVVGIDICGEEPKILTHCCYNYDSQVNEKFNESLFDCINEKIV